MDNEQILIAAKSAISVMSPEMQARFIELFEAGQHTQTQNIAQAYAVEGVNRQARLASAALESGRIMSGLVEIVYDQVSA
jgi:hypothetical protein